jgi:hypothetical protein
MCTKLKTFGGVSPIQYGWNSAGSWRPAQSVAADISGTETSFIRSIQRLRRCPSDLSPVETCWNDCTEGQKLAKQLNKYAKSVICSRFAALTLSFWETCWQIRRSKFFKPVSILAKDRRKCLHPLGHIIGVRTFLPRFHNHREGGVMCSPHFRFRQRPRLTDFLGKFHFHPFMYVLPEKEEEPPLVN